MNNHKLARKIADKKFFDKSQQKAKQVTAVLEYKLFICIYSVLSLTWPSRLCLEKTKNAWKRVALAIDISSVWKLFPCIELSLIQVCFQKEG